MAAAASFPHTDFFARAVETPALSYSGWKLGGGFATEALNEAGLYINLFESRGSTEKSECEKSFALVSNL